MDLTKLLITAGNLSVVVFVVASTLVVGLRLTTGQILAPLRDGRLVVLSLLANFALAPLAAIAVAAVLRLDEPLRVGLLLCGVAAGAPFILKLAEMAKGNIPFAVGLMVLLTVITVGYLPLVLPLLLAGVSVDAGRIARLLVLLMLIPLPIGLAARAWFQPAAARLEPIVSSVSSVSMMLVVALMTVGNFQSLLSVLGTFAILGAAIFTALCVGIGWVLGGPTAETRTVLAVGTAQRNAAAALVVASQNFTDPKVVVMITVVMIVAFAMLVPVTRVLAKRSRSASQGTQATAARD